MSETDIRLLSIALASVLLLVGLIVSKVRLHPLLALLVVALLVVLHAMRQGGSADQPPSLTVLAFGLTVALLVPLVVQAFAFATYLTDFQAAISGREGRIPYTDFVAEVPDRSEEHTSELQSH